MYSIVFYEHRNTCEREKDMTKTITLRLNEERYLRFRQLAEEDNRPLSNFIETAVLRYIEDQGYVDEFEMTEIRENIELNESLTRGIIDAEAGKGKFV
jgi:predicted DNA-binding protein